MSFVRATQQSFVIPWRESAISGPDSFTSIGLPLEYLDDLESSNPSVYAKFQHFKESWPPTGSVTRDDFHNLVRLMHQVGNTVDAEYYLRTHLLVTGDDRSYFLDAAGLDLYTKLLGNGKRKDVVEAISAFESQYSARFSNGVGGRRRI